MLLAVEAIRASARYDRSCAEEARAWLEGISLLPLHDAVLDVATSLSPTTLRTLDALHLATAITVRDELGAFFTYDRRLAESAVEHGLPAMPNCIT